MGLVSNLVLESLQSAIRVCLQVTMHSEVLISSSSLGFIDEMHALMLLQVILSFYVFLIISLRTMIAIGVKAGNNAILGCASPRISSNILLFGHPCSFNFI